MPFVAGCPQPTDNSGPRWGGVEPIKQDSEAIHILVFGRDYVYAPFHSQKETTTSTDHRRLTGTETSAPRCSCVSSNTVSRPGLPSACSVL